MFVFLEGLSLSKWLTHTQEWGPNSLWNGLLCVQQPCRARSRTRAQYIVFDSINIIIKGVLPSLSIRYLPLNLCFVSNKAVPRLRNHRHTKDEKDVLKETIEDPIEGKRACLRLFSHWLFPAKLGLEDLAWNSFYSESTTLQCRNIPRQFFSRKVEQQVDRVSDGIFYTTLWQLNSTASAVFKLNLHICQTTVVYFSSMLCYVPKKMVSQFRCPLAQCDIKGRWNVYLESFEGYYSVVTHKKWLLIHCQDFSSTFWHNAVLSYFIENLLHVQPVFAVVVAILSKNPTAKIWGTGSCGRLIDSCCFLW